MRVEASLLEAGQSPESDHKHPMRTATIGGIEVARFTNDELCDMMRQDVARARAGTLPQPRITAYANGATVAAYHRDDEFRRLMQAADIVDVDGMPLVFASRLFCREPLQERTTSTDFLLEAAEVAVDEGIRFYFLGAKPGVAARAAEHLRSRVPGLQIAGTTHGYFEPEAAPAICERIRESRADVLWVGLGSPRQERFAIENRANLEGLAWIRACGGLFDHYGGGVSRAPEWMQALGLEWMYRAAREPLRLGWRYLVTNPVALYYLATQTHD